MINFTYPDGATPIDQEQIAGLIPDHIILQSELNEWEANNIAQARLWIRSLGITKEIWSESFVIELHKKMFGLTWDWAGTFRRRQTNIGVAPHLISTDLRVLLDDVKFWLNNDTYPISECFIRLHHRLVYIHPFPNGNGRLSRLYADLSMQKLGHSVFSWGGENLVNASDKRVQYIKALKVADQNDYQPLLDFAMRKEHKRGFVRKGKSF
jgi:Fic-DOC domain mobile mystery protein B